MATARGVEKINKPMLIQRIKSLINRILGGSKMSKILEEVLAANAHYAASFGDEANLSLPLSRQFAILTCMDARLHPSKFAGLAVGGGCRGHRGW
jgi:hypothetical protein